MYIRSPSDCTFLRLYWNVRILTNSSDEVVMANIVILKVVKQVNSSEFMNNIFWVIYENKGGQNGIGAYT